MVVHRTSHDIDISLRTKNVVVVVHRTSHDIDAKNIVVVVHRTSHDIDALPWTKNMAVVVQSLASWYDRIQYMLI